MINGTHLLLYSQDPEADRQFFREILEFPFVEVGQGWLIFALPPAELGVHPSDGLFEPTHAERPMLGAVLYLMCDDVRALIQSLAARNVTCSPWRKYSGHQALPSGGEIGLYQPSHPTALRRSR